MELLNLSGPGFQLRSLAFDLGLEHLYELVLIVLYGILDAVYTVRGRTSRPGRGTLAILSIQDDVPPAVLLRGWQSTPALYACVQPPG